MTGWFKSHLLFVYTYTVNVHVETLQTWDILKHIFLRYSRLDKRNRSIPSQCELKLNQKRQITRSCHFLSLLTKSCYRERKYISRRRLQLIKNIFVWGFLRKYITRISFFTKTYRHKWGKYGFTFNMIWWQICIHGKFVFMANLYSFFISDVPIDSLLSDMIFNVWCVVIESLYFFIVPM